MKKLFFDQLQKKKGAVWSLLLASGYLKVEEIVFDERSGRYRYRLGLTNQEVRMLFEDMVSDWFSDEMVSSNSKWIEIDFREGL